MNLVNKYIKVGKNQFAKAIRYDYDDLFRAGYLLELKNGNVGFVLVDDIDCSGKCPKVKGWC